MSRDDDAAVSLVGRRASHLEGEALGVVLWSQACIEFGARATRALNNQPAPRPRGIWSPQLCDIERFRFLYSNLDSRARANSESVSVLSSQSGRALERQASRTTGFASLSPAVDKAAKEARVAAASVGERAPRWRVFCRPLATHVLGSCCFWHRTKTRALEHTQRVSLRAGCVRKKTRIFV